MYTEAYLEPSMTSTVGHLCENHKKARHFNWVLNTPLVEVLL